MNSITITEKDEIIMRLVHYFITEENYMFDEQYLNVINQYKGEVCDFDSLELMLESLELIEVERPTINHDLLLREIEIFRNQYNLKPRYYKKYVKSMSKRMFPDYYLSIKQDN
mgnify:CR=1 FL=1